MPKIVIPTALRQYAGNTAAVVVVGATAGEVLASLTSHHPDLKKHLYDANGKLRSFVNVFVNDEDVRGLQGENTPVTETDDVSIIPAIAGGVGTEQARAASSLPVTTAMTPGICVAAVASMLMIFACACGERRK